MLESALRYGRQLFKRGPKVVIPEDPNSKPNIILKIMGFYNKDSVLPRQAKKLYTAAKEQVRSFRGHQLSFPLSGPDTSHPLPLSLSELATSFLRQCWNRPSISN
jgi:hypothetical protein